MKYQHIVVASAIAMLSGNIQAQVQGADKKGPNLDQTTSTVKAKAPPQITPPEFTKDGRIKIPALLPDKSNASIVEAWRKLDSNNDGFVAPAERQQAAKHALSQVGIKDPTNIKIADITNPALKERFQKMDVNKDGFFNKKDGAGFKGDNAVPQQKLPIRKSPISPKEMQADGSIKIPPDNNTDPHVQSWKKLDTNNDGVVSVEEQNQARLTFLRERGIGDWNNDGKLAYNEVRNTRLREQFSTLDKNQDGFLTPGEMPKRNASSSKPKTPPKDPKATSNTSSPTPVAPASPKK